MERLPHAKDLVCVYFCAARPGCRRSSRCDAVSSARGRGAVCDHAHSWWLRHRLSSRTIWRVSAKRRRLLWVSSICLWLPPLRLRLWVSPVRLLRSPVLVARRGARLRLRDDRNPRGSHISAAGTPRARKGAARKPPRCVSGARHHPFASLRITSLQGVASLDAEPDQLNRCVSRVAGQSERAPV
jgi:hypothetical protein